MHQSYLQKYNFLKRNSIPILLLMSYAVALLLLILVRSGETWALCEPMTAVPPCKDETNCKTSLPAGYKSVDQGVEVDGVNASCQIVPILTEPSVNPTLTLSIDESDTIVADQIVAEYNKTNYSAHIVTIQASDISDYTLTLSDVTMAGPMTLSGASEIKGSVLADNSWGYGWDATDVANENIIYNSATNKNLKDVAVSNGSLDFSRKLVFATKFNDNAMAGTYKATATLSAVATPAAVLDYVSWNQLIYMQDMNPKACAEASVGAEQTLKDVRDDSIYTVAKLNDGKCWMTQNLRLTGNSFDAKMSKAVNKLLGLSYFDTNLPASYNQNFNTLASNKYYVMPNSNLNGFSDSNFYIAQVYYADNEEYGAYYSWFAATAGAGTSNLTSGNATSDICPRGWRMPTGGESGEIQALVDSGAETAASTVNGVSGRKFGGGFWPFAGRVFNSTLGGVGTSGRYWSSTAFDETQVYDFAFGTSTTYPVDNSDRYGGYSVRCVAK